MHYLECMFSWGIFVTRRIPCQEMPLFDDGIYTIGIRSCGEERAEDNGTGRDASLVAKQEHDGIHQVCFSKAPCMMSSLMLKESLWHHTFQCRSYVFSAGTGVSVEKRLMCVCLSDGQSRPVGILATFRFSISYKGKWTQHRQVHLFVVTCSSPWQCNDKIKWNERTLGNFSIWTISISILSIACLGRWCTDCRSKMPYKRSMSTEGRSRMT